MKTLPAAFVLACMAFPACLDAGPGVPVSFAVLSDIHYYDSALGTEGEAFETYLAHDRKMLRESEAILEAALGSIRQQDVPFVVICGDLTKDGAQASHLALAEHLQAVEQSGVEVFVIPGNHDVLNPHAFSYEGAQAIPVPNVTPGQFAEIYESYGYGQALDRDPGSLSYLVEPADNLWLLAMDSCSYLNNAAQGHPVIGGEFSAATMEWIVGVLADARRQGKTVIGMMHHGILEHYVGQAELFEDYVVRDWATASRTFAEAGLHIVLTGHYHAQDVTRRTWRIPSNPPFLFDVETGSLATYPSPYRLLTLEDDHHARVESRFVTEIDYDTGGVPFPEYAQDLTQSGVYLLAYQTLVLPPEQGGYGLPEGNLSAAVATLISDAFLAHYQGDEMPAPMVSRLFRRLTLMGDPTLSPLAQSLYNLWHDILPTDTDPVLYLGPRAIVRHSLGNHPTAPMGWADVDSFAFSGQAGEQITVRLESVPQHNGAGMRALLVLQSRVRRSRLVRIDASELPNEITATLPATGPYRVSVVQQLNPRIGVPYRGDYHLELEGSMCTVESFAPEAWTE